MLSVSDLDGYGMLAGLCGSPCPACTLRPVLDDLSVQKELKLHCIALGICCLSCPGDRCAGYLRALLVCGQALQGRRIVWRRRYLECRIQAGVALGAVLSVSDPDGYGMLAGLCGSPGPAGALRPVLDDLSVKQELKLHWIALGICCLSCPGYGRAGYLRALFICSQALQGRRVVWRQRNLECRIQAGVALGAVLAVSDPDGYGMLAGLCGSPCPACTLRPVLDDLSVKQELEHEWIGFDVHRLRRPGYGRSDLLGALPVCTEVDDLRALVGGVYDKCQAPLVIKPILIGMPSVSDLHLHLGFALSCLPGPLAFALPVGHGHAVEEEFEQNGIVIGVGCLGSPDDDASSLLR